MISWYRALSSLLPGHPALGRPDRDRRALECLWSECDRSVAQFPRSAGHRFETGPESAPGTSAAEGWRRAHVGERWCDDSKPEASWHNGPAKELRWALAVRLRAVIGLPLEFAQLELTSATTAGE